MEDGFRVNLRRPQSDAMGIPIQLTDIRHRYGKTEDTAAVEALSGVTLRIEGGAFAVLMGPSGSGKSTLLNLIGAVDRPSEGSLMLGDREIASMSERELTLIRRGLIGFVFQFFNLIPTFTVRENVAFPLHLLRVKEAEIRARVGESLEAVGLAHRAGHHPNELSGGEMQRVAIARAIVHRPPLLIADEPTGNLDTRTGESILDLLSEIHRSHAPTIVMATHSDRAAIRGDYILQVLDGEVGRAEPVR
jgi:putative ABC transport system ATP-binding protein